MEKIYQNKTISIEKLAEHIDGKLWSNNSISRLYIECGDSTSKMETKTYFTNKSNGQLAINCTVICDSQHKNWCVSQAQEIIDSLDTQINNILEKFGEDIKILEINLVKGYYLRWQEVRVAINRFGKKDTRKRQVINLYEGDMNLAPGGFAQLNDEQFLKAKKMRDDEVYFGYGETPSF